MPAERRIDETRLDDYALTAADRYVFRTKGLRYNLVRSWLSSLSIGRATVA